MPTTTERFQKISDDLTEAGNEINDLIGQLRAAGVTAEGEVILQAIEAKATGLKDIVPGP